MSLSDDADDELARYHERLKQDRSTVEHRPSQDGKGDSHFTDEEDTDDHGPQPSASKRRRGRGRPRKPIEDDDDLDDQSRQEPAEPPGPSFTTSRPATPATPADLTKQVGHPKTPSSSPSQRRPPPSLDPHRTDKAGRTKLFAYTGSGQLDKVKQMIDFGADVNFKDHAGWAPLHEAALKGQVAVAKLLIEHGAKVNVRGYGDDTPLHDACSNGFADMVQLLVDHGADVYALNGDHEQPLDVCDNDDCEHIIQHKQCELDRRMALDPATKRTSLHELCASADDQIGAIVQLLDQGVNSNPEDRNKRTPLHDAAQNGHLRVVRLLVDRGAIVNHADCQGFTVLHHACRAGHLDIVHFLLEQGADIHAHSHDEKSPYDVTSDPTIRRDLAARIDDERKQRATSDAIDEATFTTLRKQRQIASSSSAAKSTAPSTSALPSTTFKPTDPSSTSSRQKTLSREERKIQAIMRSFAALEQQQQQHQPVSRRSTISSPSTPRTSSRRNVRHSSAQPPDDCRDDMDLDPPHTLKKCTMADTFAGNEGTKSTPQPAPSRTSRPTSPSSEPKSLPSPFASKPTKKKQRLSSRKSSPASPATSSRECSVEATANDAKPKKLNVAKLDLEKKDTCGRTHLHRWAIRGDAEVVNDLLQAGANPNITDHAGYSPLHEASLRGHVNVVRLLLDNGANIDAKGMDLDTPLHDAIDNAHPDVVALLLDAGANPHLCNKDDQSCLALADASESVDITHLIKQALEKQQWIKIKKEELVQVNAALQAPSPPIAKKRRLTVTEDLSQPPETCIKAEAISKQELNEACQPMDTDPPVQRRTMNPMDIHMLTESQPVHLSTTRNSYSAPSLYERQQHEPPAAHAATPYQQPPPRHTRPPPSMPLYIDPPYHPATQHTSSSTPLSSASMRHVFDIPRTPIPSSLADPIIKQERLQSPPMTSTSSLSAGPAHILHAQPPSSASSANSSPMATSPISPVNQATPDLTVAMRYLPLYTVQLDGPSDALPYHHHRHYATCSSPSSSSTSSSPPPVVQQESALYVLDLQVSRLLNLPIHLLWHRYPHLRRRPVTNKEKERLWLPLSKMICASPHYSQTHGPDKKRKAAALAEQREQEKQHFLLQPLYFVQLDPVISLIKNDYSYLSKKLITISLDVGYQPDQRPLSPVSHLPPHIALSPSSSSSASPPYAMRSSPQTAITTPTPPPQLSASPSPATFAKTPLKKRPLFSLPPKLAMKTQKHTMYSNH